MTDSKNDREWRRLSELYVEKGDEELLDLYDRREDLTELAQQVLEEAVRQRGLATGGEAEEAPAEANRGDVLAGPSSLAEGEQRLVTFRDALQAASAVEVLRGEGIAHRIIDRSQNDPAAYQRAYALDLVVAAEDAARARQVLQRELNLFPPAEDGDGAGDFHGFAQPEGFAQLGDFSRAQALVVAQALGEGRFSFLWEDSQDDPLAEQERVHLSVAAPRLDDALALMEAIAETLPEDE